ncbi:MAG: DUF6955 family protein [Desulfohalobiaceae bacterium]
MSKTFVVLLDDKRMEALKGSGLEDKVEYMFGGNLKAFTMEIPDDKAQAIMKNFDTARTDSRGAITDTPLAFNRTLFEEIAKAKTLDPKVVDNTLARVDEIKELAEKESDYLPPPQI